MVPLKIPGLNLTACNNVILVDMWWNPALEVSSVSFDLLSILKGYSYSCLVPNCSCFHFSFLGPRARMLGIPRTPFLLR